MEIYVAVLEKDAGAGGTEADLTSYNDRDKGMINEYEKACLEASEAIAQH